MKITEELLLQHANKAYNEGNASFTVEKEKCALLVIDMQDEFVKPEWTTAWIPEATRQVPKIKKVIEHCRAVNIPVIYTVFSKTHLYYDRPRAGSCMPNRFPELGDEPGWFVNGKVWHELEPREDEIVIHKPSYGAFYDTPLDTILKGMGKDTVIICGTLTNCCCGTTARQAYERGYYAAFGDDITSTYTKEMHDAEVSTLRFAFAKIVTADDILKL